MSPTPTLAFTAPSQTDLFAELSQECQRECLDTAQYCQLLGGTFTTPQVLRLFRECARACRTSLASLAIGSQLTQPLLAACRALCIESARLCAEFRGTSGKHKQFETCEELCRDCAALLDALVDGRSPHSAAVAAA